MPSSKLDGLYSNFFKVGHNAFDFGQFYFGIEGAELDTRVISSPVYAKALLEILHEFVEQYEKNHGAKCVEDKGKSDPLLMAKTD